MPRSAARPAGISSVGHWAATGEETGGFRSPASKFPAPRWPPAQAACSHPNPYAWAPWCLAAPPWGQAGLGARWSLEGLGTTSALGTAPGPREPFVCEQRQVLWQSQGGDCHQPQFPRLCDPLPAPKPSTPPSCTRRGLGHGLETPDCWAGWTAKAGTAIWAGSSSECPACDQSRESAGRAWVCQSL